MHKCHSIHTTKHLPFIDVEKEYYHFCKKESFYISISISPLYPSGSYILLRSGSRPQVHLEAPTPSLRPQAPLRAFSHLGSPRKQHPPTYHVPRDYSIVPPTFLRKLLLFLPPAPEVLLIVLTPRFQTTPSLQSRFTPDFCPLPPPPRFP
jgi:hypothetical protein